MRGLQTFQVFHGDLRDAARWRQQNRVSVLEKQTDTGTLFRLDLLLFVAVQPCTCRVSRKSPSRFACSTIALSFAITAVAPVAAGRRPRSTPIEMTSCFCGTARSPSTSAGEV